MKFIRFLLPILLLAFASSIKAQQKTVRLITINQLEKRVGNSDTVFIVNFWATWCEPCVKELPAFNQLQKVYSKQPLKVLFVSMDFKSKLKTNVIPFVQNHKFVSEVYLADKNIEQEFIDRVDKSWSGALPGTLFINSKKNLRKFYEQEFTYNELNKLYQNSK